jgi:hypothetical protein
MPTIRRGSGEAKGIATQQATRTESSVIDVHQSHGCGCAHDGHIRAQWCCAMRFL